MVLMENNKYLDPKFSEQLHKLYSFLKNRFGNTTDDRRYDSRAPGLASPPSPPNPHCSCR